jgi:Domain of unknown function (DUF4157)
MERHLGGSFGGVTVHEGHEASAASQAISAKAFSAGQTVVLGAEAGSSEEKRRRLLAHELTHVRQSDHVPAREPFVLGSPASPLEREADDHAERLVRAVPRATRANAAARTDTAVTIAPAGTVLRQSDAGTAAASGPGAGRRSNGGAPDSGAPDSTVPAASPRPVAPAATGICGPDVRQQMVAVVAATKAAYSGWSDDQKDEACWALENTQCGPVAWDIREMHNADWLSGYQPACATPTANPRCDNTVQVGSQCFYHGTPNYVIFGVMCKLCGIWQTTMDALIWLYKHSSANYAGSVAWADAGYNDWPSVADPPGDRPSCLVNCSRPYAGGPMTVHWYPSSSYTETVSTDCEKALDTHRDLRDNPPNELAGHCP